MCQAYIQPVPKETARHFGSRDRSRCKQSMKGKASPGVLAFQRNASTPQLSFTSVVPRFHLSCLLLVPTAISSQTRFSLHFPSAHLRDHRLVFGARPWATACDCACDSGTHHLNLRLAILAAFMSQHPVLSPPFRLSRSPMGRRLCQCQCLCLWTLIILISALPLLPLAFLCALSCHPPASLLVRKTRMVRHGPSL